MATWRKPVDPGLLCVSEAPVRGLRAKRELASPIRSFQFDTLAALVSTSPFLLQHDAVFAGCHQRINPVPQLAPRLERFRCCLFGDSPQQLVLAAE
jgi:hypothetical protein